MALHAREELEAAAVLYEQARAQEPGQARWPYLLGLLRLTLKQSHQAAEALRAAHRLQPSSGPVRLKLARALFESGDLDGAERAASGVPAGEPEAEYWIGRAKLARGDRSGVEHLRQASAAAPGFSAAHYALAMALRDAGDSAAAGLAFARYRANPMAEPPQPRQDPFVEELERLREGTPLEQVRRGIAEENAGRLEQAARFQRRALELDPNLVQAHINLVSLYGTLARPAEAEEHYRKALALNANQPELHYNFGVLAASQKRLGEAEAAFRRTIEMNPYHAGAMVNLGQVLEWREKWNQAEPFYRDAIRARPNFGLAHFQLGRWLVARGRHREAVEHLKRAAAPGETNALFWFGLATALDGAGQRTEAARAAVHARQLAAAASQMELVAAIERSFPALAGRPR